jgi:hypothetical protein
MQLPIPHSPLVRLCFLSTFLFPQATAPSPTQAAGICAASPVHATRYSGWSAAPRIPWIETKNHRIAGFLFFTGNRTGPDSLMHTHGRMPDGSATKILWYVRVPGGNTKLTIAARRLGGEDSVRRVVQEVSPPKNYPSIVDIPLAGCWKLSMTSGRVRGTVVMQVIDTPSNSG